MTYANEKSIPAVQKHDTAPPPALQKFMMQQWKASKVRAVPVRHLAAYRARRAALSAEFEGDSLIIPTGHEKVRANDTVYRFRPGSDFFYLTGNTEPDCVLVMVPKDEGHESHLFVAENPGKTSITFFTDRARGELWVGPRLGVAASRVRYGVDAAHDLSELGEFLKLAPRPRVLRGLSEATEALLGFGSEDTRDKALGTTLSELRLLKDAAEVKELEQVIAATHRGFNDVMKSLPRARSERTVEGVFALRAREEGHDVGYGTIAAAGAHACVLHWTHNSGPVRKGELLLLDAGVEGHALYTADITRTVPISGRFSPAQKAIYQLVLDAQLAAIAAVKPGNDFMEPNRRAMHVLAHGLERLGILPMSAAEALREENQFFKRYSLHNVSHMLGLDVHDCARARQEVYRHGPLRAGMVLTVEPGLYFQKDDLTVPAKYRGIGVRIEDDVLVTARGCRVLSKAIPKDVAAVEAWVRREARRR